jgi:hypothetical protein
MKGYRRGGELLQIWRYEVGVQVLTTAELLGRAGVADWFRVEFEDKQGVTARKAGRLLSKYAGRIVDGLRVVNAGSLHRGVMWQLEEM